MTFVTIIGADEDLQKIKFLSEEFFRENQIPVTSEIYYRLQDSFDASSLPAILPLVFSGVTTLVQVINLIINVQEKKRLSSDDFSELYVKIKLSNGKELDLKLSGEITPEDIQLYQNLVEKLVVDFQRVDDSKMSFKMLGNLDISRIDSLFNELSNKLTDIRILVSIPQKMVGFHESSFDKISLKEAIKTGVEKPFT